MIIIDLKELGVNRLSFYLALEEYLLKKQIYCFFVWRIDKSIIVGKHQLLDCEVNIEYAKKENIEIFRRNSGGGAIYADTGCFMYSFITDIKEKTKAYEMINTYIIKALTKLNVNCKLSGRNDLLYNDKKFSGIAMYKDVNGSVLHGTFLYDTDFNSLVSALSPSSTKLISKGISSVKSRVINMKEYLKIPKEEVIKALENEIITNDYYLKLTNDDIDNVKDIEKKYLDKTFIYNKKIPYIIKVNKRFPCGEVILCIDLVNNIIKKVNIYGDFFHHKDLSTLCNLFSNVFLDMNIIINIINKININDYIEGLTNTDFINLFKEGLYGEQ